MGESDINNLPKRFSLGANEPFWVQKMAHPHNFASAVRIFFLNFAQ